MLPFFGDGMFVVSHELPVAVFAHVILLSVVSIPILDYLSASAAGADEHVFVV